MDAMKQSRRRFMALGGGLAATLLTGRRASAMELPEGIPAGSIEATVTGHIDGDKFEVDVNGKKEVVVFVATDAPEIAKDDKPAECFAQESADFLKSLLPEKTVVYLEQDEADRDNKKRRLRYVWALAEDPEDDPILIDEVMIEEGYAVFKERDDNKIYDDRLKKAEETAKSEQNGIWKAGGCGGGHEKAGTVSTAQAGGSSGSGSSGSAAVGTAENPAPVGKMLKVDGQEITVTDYLFTDTFGIDSAKGGYIYLLFEARIKNVDSKNHGYEEARFSLKDVDNNWDYEWEWSVLNGDGFGAGELQPGQTVSGQMIFEVQEGSRRIRIQYDTSYMGDGEVYWLIER